MSDKALRSAPIVLQGPRPRGNVIQRVLQASRLRGLASAVAERFNLAGLAGLSFKGSRDFYEALGYDRDLDPRKYWDRFRRGGIARRLVIAYPKATWRGGTQVFDSEDPNTVTPFEEAADELFTRLKVWRAFRRADELSGLGAFSGLLITGPKGDLETEMGRISAEDVKMLSPYGPRHIRVDTLDKDVESERYGLPLIYTVDGIADTSRRVHWTRVIHVADGLTEDDINGTPRLEAVWNLLDDLDKTTGGGSEATWNLANQGMQVNVDPDMELEPDEEEALEEEVEDYIHGQRRWMRTRGTEIKPLGSTVPNFGPNASAIIDQISAVTEIPQRILMGSERGELASSQDRNAWSERVQDRREDFGEALVRQFVDRMIDHGALPEPAEPYQVWWPETQDLTRKERAELAKATADINQSAGETVVTVDEIRDQILDLPPLDEVMPEEDLNPEPEQPPVVQLPPQLPPGGGQQDEQGDQGDQQRAAQQRAARIRSLGKKKVKAMRCAGQPRGLRGRSLL